MAKWYQHLAAFFDPTVAVNEDGYLVGANGFFDSGNGTLAENPLLDARDNSSVRDFFYWNPSYDGFAKSPPAVSMFDNSSNVPSFVDSAGNSSDEVADSYSEPTLEKIFQDILDSTEKQNAAAQASADRAMDFNAAQAELNRAWQEEQNRKAMDFSAAQAQLNRDWQVDQNQKAMDFSERMSNTSYQRAMADLQAAGLNPKLAAKLSGASAPSGVTSSGSSPSGVTSSGSSASGSPASMAAANLAPLASVLSTYITGADSLDRQNNGFVQGIIGAIVKSFLS